MIRINELALPFDHTQGDFLSAICGELRCVEGDILEYQIVRRAIDARHKQSIKAVYTLDVQVADEPAVLAVCAGNSRIGVAPQMEYVFPVVGAMPENRPVVVGSGPCGLFAGLVLARAGLKPVVIERGNAVEQRVQDVNAFWTEGRLNPQSNVQFGEGGAGTFSDGKLTTQIKDKHNRFRLVLSELVAAGAPQEIMYQARPHIGTDKLIQIVRNIRETIISLGGQVRFGCTLTGLEVASGRVCGAVVNENENIRSDYVILAIGHSARDTFAMLCDSRVAMSAKSFSIGVRIEHPQSVIDKSQYGKFAGNRLLGPADYKVVNHCKNGRSAYSFCMCPGGRVIGSASEPERLVTNGMSVYARNGKNANSALLVGVGPAEFGSDHPLAGVEFQRHWEHKAFMVGGRNYYAPVQLVGDFLADRPSGKLGSVEPSYTPGVTPTDLRECLPDFVAETLKESLSVLDRKLHGFAMADAVMTALESRSSSPVRIERGEDGQSLSLAGLFPAGEGAGYAGGIMSADIDGIKAAEAVISRL